jgi:hypothetical protein
MFRRVGAVLSVIFVFAILAAATEANNQSGSRKPALNPSDRAPASRNKTPRTPLERLLLPALKKKLAAHAAANPKAARAIRSLAPPISAPNFGGFLAAPYYPARLEASCITDPFNCGVATIISADFNQDGKPDVAVLQYDGTLNILSSNGNGTFSAPVAYSNPNFSSTGIQQAFAVDVNQDGTTDIVAFDVSNNAILVYLNKNGVFSTPTSIDMTGDPVSCIAIGDVNGDGVPDVVTIASNITGVSQSTVTVQTYLGVGDGTFTQPTGNLTQALTIPAQVEFPGNLAIALGDLNNDGKLDIAADLLEYTGQLTGQIVATVALGNGDGSFGALNVNNPVSDSFTGTFFFFMVSAGVQIKDLNGDGNADLAIDLNASGVDASGNSSILDVALGSGSGGFTSTVQTANVVFSNQILYADVNGDGIQDLIQTSGTMDIWLGNGDGTFTLPANGNTYIVDGGGNQSLILADFNGDGNTDIAQLGGDYKQVSMFAGNGKGSFYGAPALSSTTDAAPGPGYIQLQDVADVQGSGFTSGLFIDSYNYPEIAVVTGLGNGTGSFSWTVGLSSTADPTLGYLEPVQADFNGDGKQDLLIAGTDGSLAVALSNGDGSFQTPVALNLPVLSCPLDYAATGDLNGDGKVDVVVAYGGDFSCFGSGSTASGYFVALGNGDGTFGTPAFTAQGSELYSVTLADINMDGNIDLILDDAPFIAGGTFAVYMLPGNGDGTFGASTTLSSDYMVSQVIAGDYNNDGKPDLILFSEGEQTDQDPLTTAGILLLPGNGDGTFGASSQIGTGNFFLNGALTDVNGDGLNDLVVALYQTIGQPNTYYGLSTLLGVGGGAFSSPVNTLQSMDSESVFIGNFYADNAPDVMVGTAYGTALYLAQGGTGFTLASSGSSITYGQTETLTATVTASMPTRPSPTGNVSFYDGTTLLSSSALQSGSATYSTSTLSSGTHNLTAVYSGDPNFNPNTSTAASLTVTALAPAFTLSATPQSTSVSAGQTAVATVTLSANASFSDSVSLTCSGAPANATCAINPGSVTLSAGSTSTATLLLTTTTPATSAGISSIPWPPANSGLATVLCFFSLTLMLIVLSKKRLHVQLAAAAIVCLGIGLTGCGGSSSKSSSGSSTSVNTTAAGTYTITVTATPSSAGTAQTTTISVTVQ